MFNATVYKSETIVALAKYIGKQAFITEVTDMIRPIVLQGINREKFYCFFVH